MSQYNFDNAYRKFNDLPTKFTKENNAESDEENSVNEEIKNVENSKDLFELIAKSEIGNNLKFTSPFGIRRVCYCDYTATGKPLSFIEDFIRDEVLPEYGSTHTTSSVTSLQTTLFRNEARDIIRNCVNAGENDIVVFVGSGCTNAVHKLINGLNLSEPPIVFVSPFEHHSNLLPWRELFSEMVYIEEAEQGGLDLNDLERKLKLYSSTSKTKVKIGCFTAASNITGILVDTNAVSILLHKYGFLAFFDYATAAPHVDINMNPFVHSEDNRELVYKDAIYFSAHKFIGGPQTPGILVAKKNLFQNKVPNGCGGGTVFYVTEKDHRYLINEEMREEGGTPAIVESIRAGMVFQLKNSIGVNNILNRERLITRKAIDFMKEIPNIHIGGSLNAERLSLFSFLIRHEQTGLFLHSNFVSSLLNDLFGIQIRSGCACAGPYSQYLLGINFELAKAYEEVLLQDSRLDRNHLRIRHDTAKTEILRPGFARFNLAFFLSDERVDFILSAIKFICEHGWKFLPQYIFNLETGEWRHRNHQVFKDRKWLGNINYKNNEFNFHRKNTLNVKESEDNCPKNDEECIELAYKALETTKSLFQMPDQRLIFDEETLKLRWFLLPSEAYGIIHSIKSLYNNESYKLPFMPRKYEFVTTEIQKRLDTNESIIKNDRKFENFSKFVEDYDSYYQIDQLVKIVKNQVKEKIEKIKNVESLNCPFVKKKYAKLDFESDEFFLKENQEVKQSSVKHTNITDDDSNKELENKFESTIKICDESIEIINKKVNKHEWHSPPKLIFKHFNEATNEFDMIQNGDRVLVCLSGGKDSMSLLHCMKQYQFVAKSKNINFELGAVTVDPKTPSYNPSTLKSYLAELNLPYFYEEQTILDTAASLPYECSSICSFCSRMKRGRIYHTARKNGYNVLALGQHLDDLTESFMMSLFYNGKLWCMKAHYTNEEGDLRIIRPFVYVREKELRSFAEGNRLPIIAENCPACFEAPKERMRIKQLLAQQELNFPCLFNSLLSAIKPIISINKCKLSIKTLSEHTLKLIQTNSKLYKDLTNTNTQED